MQTWTSGPDSKFCTVPCILQNSDSDSVIDYVERSVSAVSYSTPSIRPISRKSTHPDITLKLPKILESRGREVEEGGTKLQYLDHYYHLISHRSKSSLSKTAKLTWKDTDSDTLSTGLPSWVMSATQEFKVHVTMHSHWKWKKPIKTSHFSECPWLLRKIELTVLHNICMHSNSDSGTLKECCCVTPTNNESLK